MKIPDKFFFSFFPSPPWALPLNKRCDFLQVSSARALPAFENRNFTTPQSASPYSKPLGTISLFGATFYSLTEISLQTLQLCRPDFSPPLG